MSIPLRLAVRLYARLLRLYPRRFREEFADEMQAVFAEAVANAKGAERLELFVREVCDWPGAAIRAHWQERKHPMNAQSLPDERISGRAMAATLALFMIPCLYEIMGDKGLPSGLMSALFAGLAITFLVLCGVGMFKGFPRWSLPALGLLLTVAAFFGLMALGSWLEPMLGQLPFFRATPGNEEARLRHQAFIDGFFWIGRLLLVGLTILVCAVVPPLRPLYQRIRRDWTLLSFILYGAAIGTVAFAFDEYGHDASYQIASMIFLAAGAWAYLRAQRPGQRLLVLLIGATLSMSTIAAGKWLIVPMQNWPQWLAWHPPQVERRFESLRTVAEMGWMLLVIAAPAVLALWPRPAPLTPPGQPAQGG